LHRSPESLEKNVKELVSKFESNGLSLDDFIQACLKHPSLFCLSPKTIEEHINIIRFSHFNNNNEIDNKNFWSRILKTSLRLGCSSSLLLTEGIIVPKMFENGIIPKELKGNRLKQKLEDYLKANPKQKYVLNIKNIPGETGHIELLQSYLEKLTDDLQLPKDMFKINVLS
jgi:hypothetical protein